MASPNNLNASALDSQPIISDSEKGGIDEASDTTRNEGSDTPTTPKHVKAKKQMRFPTHDIDETRVIEKTGTNTKQELTEEECYDELGFSFPTWKKWSILSVIFIVQVSMNFNTSLYSNAVPGISEEFGVKAQTARWGAAVFLITYAFGCELWAPWSEELGRRPILQASLFLVNIWQIPVGIAPNFATIMVGRALGGISSAGGSVTLGMIADMWESETQQYAVAFVVFSSVGGSVLGPVVGGFVEAFLPWRWNIWIQLIFGGFVQALHFSVVPETRSTCMMDKIARKRRKAGETNIYGPNEITPLKERINLKEIMITFYRPFKMFLTEPIVLTLSLLSGFSDALIFMFIQSFALVYKQWGFSTVEIGLAFIPLLVGYFLAWFMFIPAIRRNIAERAAKPNDETAQYESRLWWLLYTAPCLPIGLFIFAWTSTGPPLHWIGSMIAAILVGIANYSIYMATIDYMITAYGPYSASATGGNGWSRDFLAGVLTVPATPFFTSKSCLCLRLLHLADHKIDIGKSAGGSKHLAYASTILACISLLLVLAVYVIYWKGPVLRKRSPFAQQLADHQSEHDTLGRRLSKIPSNARPKNNRTNSYARSQQSYRVRQATGSRMGSAANSRRNSMETRSSKNTPVQSRRNSLTEEIV